MQLDPDGVLSVDGDGSGNEGPSHNLKGKGETCLAKTETSGASGAGRDLEIGRGDELAGKDGARVVDSRN